MNKLLQNKQWLEELYLTGWLSARAIAEKVGVCKHTVLRALRKSGIPIRKCTPKSPPNHFFDVIDSELKAYWLGFITADGNIHRNGNLLQINLSIIDIEHLKLLTNHLGGCVKSTNYTGHQGCYLAVSNRHLCNSLASLGVLPNKTCTEQRAIFLNLREDLKWHFIRGLYDGDGCLHDSKKYKNHFALSICGEHSLIAAVADFISAQLGLKRNKMECRKHVSYLRWCGKTQCDAIGKKIYENATVYLNRKFNIYRNMKLKRSKTIRYHGVTRTLSGKWNAYIWLNGKRIHLGNFSTEDAAAKAYDRVAKKEQFPLYKRNFPDRND